MNTENTSSDASSQLSPAMALDLQTALARGDWQACLGITDHLTRGAAVEPLREIFLAQPNAVTGWKLVEDFIAAGMGEQACALLESAVRQQPRNAALGVCWGRALTSIGRDEEALTCFEAGTRAMPDLANLWVMLAETQEQLEDFAGALESMRHAVALPGVTPFIRGKFARALRRAGYDTEARAQYAASQPWLGCRPAPTGKPRVGIFTLPGRGITPTSFLIPPDPNVEMIYLLPGQADARDVIAQRYDVIFNAAADPDVVVDMLGDAARLFDPPSPPILNPLADILRTTRESVSRRLDGIAGAVIPRTRLVQRAQILNGGTDTVIAEIGFPLLARPTGRHGGHGLELAQNLAELRRYAEGQTDSAFYLTQFVEFRSDDSVYRKYRAVFIDRVMIPCHLVVGESWLNHFGRRLAEEERYRREEEHFLRDPRSKLGDTAFNALNEACRRMDMDYAGIDFAVTRNGDLLLFESNATMRVSMRQENEFAYRRPYAQHIQNAMRAMLVRRASATPPLG